MPENREANFSLPDSAGDFPSPRFFGFAGLISTNPWPSLNQPKEVLPRNVPHHSNVNARTQQDVFAEVGTSRPGNIPQDRLVWQSATPWPRSY